MQILRSYYSACRWSLNFIKSEFAGQLPKQYGAGEDATKQIPTHMNDMNIEEPTRYVSQLASLHKDTQLMLILLN